MQKVVEVSSDEEADPETDDMDTDEEEEPPKAPDRETAHNKSFPTQESSSSGSVGPIWQLQVPESVIARRASNPLLDHTELDKAVQSLPEGTP